MLCTATDHQGAILECLCIQVLSLLLASAVIGVLWAFINMHYDKKRNAQGELDRRSGYARYLRRQIKQIAYNQNTIKNVLGDMYKSPGVYNAIYRSVN